ncbi:MAG: mannose-1-phosphate guanylyltransferase [Bacteroidaceae bacterium]|nr:mannose-1-phosphate guanylyltransferase [Bacteroidaceae bacterium]
MKDHNYCVIMAGGIGSRFWPLSRKEMPKQFIDFFGTGSTLLQQTYDRYSRLVGADRVFVVTNTDYTALVSEQLPTLPVEHILSEPTRRNTAPCLAWATYHIHAIDPEATIVFTPSDHLIMKEEEFTQAIKAGMEFINRSPCLLCVGIRPNRPETRYGYIQIGDEGEDTFHSVKTFTEKPERELAEIFVESGEFYWNAGIFLGKSDTIINAFRTHVPELAFHFEANGEETSPYSTPAQERHFIEEHFPSCPNVSIEYGLLEKADNVYVMTCDFGWSDLGTWSTFHNLLPKDGEENATVSTHGMYYDCHGCLTATSQPKKLIVAQGLEDYLIIDTDQVLLICPKDDPAMLRKIINDAQVKMGDEYV